METSQSRPAPVAMVTMPSTSPSPSPSPLLQPPAAHAPANDEDTRSIRPPSVASGSHLSVTHGRNSRDPSIRSRRSSRPASIQVAVTAAALINNPDARQIRQDLYTELVRGWYHLSTSSKLLLAYYLGATIVEIVVTITIAVLERDKARTCFPFLIFLGLYLARAIVITTILLRRFLYVRPDDLPRDVGGACGAHYKTMINWASLFLLLFSIALLTSQSHCAEESPALFYLVLTFSLLGYLCLLALFLLWVVVLFCFNGLVVVLELFGVGPKVMKWEGATQDMLDAIPVIKYTKPETDMDTSLPEPVQDQPTCSTVSPSSSEKPATMGVTPSIVVMVSDEDGNKHSPRPESVTIHMEHQSGADVSRKGDDGMDLGNNTNTNTSTIPLEELSPEEKETESRISTSCAICLCDYEDLEELRHLPCDHYFHKDCVDEWLKLKRTCPMCKFDISQIRRGSRFWSRRGRSASGSRGRSTNRGWFSRRRDS